MKKLVHPIVIMDINEEDPKGQEESNDSLLIDSDRYNETLKPSKSGKRARAVVVVPQCSVSTRVGVTSGVGLSKHSWDSGEGLPVKQKWVEVTPSDSEMYKDSNNEEE